MCEIGDNLLITNMVDNKNNVYRAIRNNGDGLIAYHSLICILFSILGTGHLLLLGESWTVGGEFEIGVVSGRGWATKLYVVFGWGC